MKWSLTEDLKGEYHLKRQRVWGGAKDKFKRPDETEERPWERILRQGNIAYFRNKGQCLDQIVKKEQYKV